MKIIQLFFYENKNIHFLKTSLEENALWDTLQKIDGDRYIFLLKVLKGYRYFKEGLIDLAITEISSHLTQKKDGSLIEPFKESYINKFNIAGLAIEILQFIIEYIENKQDYTLIKFYNSLSEHLKVKKLKLPKITRSTIKDFAEECNVNELIDQIKLNEGKIDKYRTIHGVKGAEFQSVLLYLDNKEQLLEPNIDSPNDTTRIFYVGCSRAKQLLFIALPMLDSQDKQKLNELYGELIEIHEEAYVYS